MNEPIILADQSLIKNGEFDEGVEEWTKGPTNPRNIGVASAPWWNDPEPEHGFEIRYLTASDRASVYQVLKAPKTLGSDAGYVLSFFHETYNTLPGKVLVELLPEGGEKLELPLDPTHPALTDEDLARLEGGQPFDFEPRATVELLKLSIKEGDNVRVSIISPADPGAPPRSRIHVARLRLRLNLPPLQLQELLLDGVPRAADRPLFLCYGAEGSQQHSVSFVPRADSAWRDTQAALTPDDLSRGAIDATPAWETDHPLASAWRLECPVGDTQDTQSLSLTLHNQYSAEPYTLNVSLGHHRLAVSRVLEAAYDPVLGQDVRLGVQVISHYTDQPLAGRDVTWMLDGQPLADAVTTDEDGWAFLTYEPKTWGVHVLKASAPSLYEPSGVFSHELTVRVLEKDPWPDVLVMGEGTDAPWAERIGYPNRGASYFLKLNLPADSPLLGSELSLLWDGTPADELGVQVSPPLGQPESVPGRQMEWALQCEDRIDGQFTLSLRCSRLRDRSPAKRMSLARNRVTIGEVREVNTSPVIDEQESVLLRIQVLHQIVSGSGDPVVNALVDWEGPRGTVSTVTGAGGWASVLDTPTEAGAYRITAKVRAHAEMAPIERIFDVQAVATTPWSGQARYYLDEDESDLALVGVLCRRGARHTFRVIPTPGSPLAGKPMELKSDPADSGGLVIGTPTANADGGWSWPISSEVGSSRSQFFAWTLTSTGLTGARRLAGRLLSPDLADEVRVLFDQVQADIGSDRLYPCLGTVHRYTFLPHALSPLVGLAARLIWTGTSAEQLAASVEPPLDQPQPFSDGGASWRLDFTASRQRGEFALALQLPQLAQQVPANAMMLAHNKLRIETLNTPIVDPVVGQGGTWMWAQVVSAFTAEAVAQVPVNWAAQGQSLPVETDAHGWSGFSFVPLSAQAHRIEATVTSPYDGHQQQQAMEVTALATDPWQGLMASFDGQTAKPWGSATWFPRRKGQHQLDVQAPANSPLFGRELTLGMTGTGPAELGMTFTLGLLGTPRVFSERGLQYRFNVADHTDGSCAMRLAASKLASLSSANALSQGPGSQVLSFRVSASAERKLDWGQWLEEQVTVVSSISGRPMRGVPVTWRSPELGEVSTVTDLKGVARLRFRPSEPGLTPLTATVGDALYSQTLALPFTLSEPREIRSLVYIPASQPTAEMALATVVSALTGEPLASVEVMWELEGVKLKTTLTGPDGVARLSPTGLTTSDGVLVAYVKGGRGGWDMASTLVNNIQTPANIKNISYSPNYLYPQMWVTFKAVIVADETGARLPDREVFVSFDRGSYEPDRTDANGEVTWRAQAMNTGQTIYFAVEVRNTLRPPQRIQIYAQVLRP